MKVTAEQELAETSAALVASQGVRGKLGQVSDEA